MLLVHDEGFSYTPDPDFNGDHSLVYQICDPKSLCDTASGIRAHFSILRNPVASKIMDFMN